MKSKDTVPLAYCRLWSKEIGVDVLTLYSISTFNRLGIRLKKDATDVNVSFSVTTTPFDTVWNHIVLVVNRTTDKALLYMNKVKDATEADMSSLPGDISNVSNMRWGSRVSGADPFEGALDELRIYTGVPTQTDIDFLHDNPGAPLKSTTRIKNLRRKVKRVNEVGSFGMSHIEVLV